MRHSILSLVALSLCIASPTYAIDYAIDPDHSSVGFSVPHLTISNVKGKFAKFSGTFSFDPKEVKRAKASAIIDVSSINTNQEKRDNHLRSADFFDTDKHATISFVSKEITPISQNQFKAAGDLSIRGVTKPVVLDVTYGGSVKDHFGNERAAFTAKVSLDRREFGLTWNKVLDTGGLVVGDTVDVTLEIEGVKATPESVSKS